MAQEQAPQLKGRFERWFEAEVVQPMTDFQDPKQEWRRLFSELLGTFFLVLVAAGGGMMGQAFPNTISRTAAVTAPGLMVHGDHLVHGEGLRRASEPCGEPRVRAAGRLPVAAGARLHRGPARRSDARGACSCSTSSTCRRRTVELPRRRGTPPWPRSGWSCSSPWVW